LGAVPTCIGFEQRSSNEHRAGVCLRSNVQLTARSWYCCSQTGIVHNALRLFAVCSKGTQRTRKTPGPGPVTACHSCKLSTRTAGPQIRSFAGRRAIRYHTSLQRVVHSVGGILQAVQWSDLVCCCSCLCTTSLFRLQQLRVTQVACPSCAP
jgi:hypothetical protein